jgi:hypothetical protein
MDDGEKAVLPDIIGSLNVGGAGNRLLPPSLGAAAYALNLLVLVKKRWAFCSLPWPRLHRSFGVWEIKFALLRD